MQRNCFVISITVLFLVYASSIRAAEWRECEKAKIRQLNLEQSRRAASPSHKRKSSKHRSESASDSAEQIDDWLWKNCREYSYELRTLEQQRM
jgi:hypothetical protein